MYRWMGSHFHYWIDYDGVAFSIELLEWGRALIIMGWGLWEASGTYQAKINPSTPRDKNKDSPKITAWLH